jgi:phage-related minor tail protein
MANGGAFDRSSAIPFARGGVFNSPTLFRFANGGAMQNGVMGEAGPEAIMPLARGPGGKLGVQMHGSSGAIHIDASDNRTISIGAGASPQSVADLKAAFQQDRAERAAQIVDVVRRATAGRHFR